jgi:DNA end-binding protein Ku
MPRELWKGAIQFGLVHIPVSLFPAEERQELSFTMLDRRDMQPVGYKRFNKTTGDEVAYEQIVKGYELDEGHFVTLEKEDFKRANVEATQTVDIVGFIERESLAPYFFESPYYLAPGKHGDKGYALLRETLVRTGRVGIATVVIRTREHIAALYAVDNVLVLNTLRYASELRNPGELKVPDDLARVKVTPRELDMAERLVEDMAVEWDPTKYHDTYRDDLLKLIEEKAAGKVRKAPKAAKEPASADVIDFAALLERSLAGGKRTKAGEGKAAAAKARRKPPHRGGSRAASHRRAA